MEFIKEKINNLKRLLNENSIRIYSFIIVVSWIILIVNYTLISVSIYQPNNTQFIISYSNKFLSYHI